MRCPKYNTDNNFRKTAMCVTQFYRERLVLIQNTRLSICSIARFFQVIAKRSAKTRDVLLHEIKKDKRRIGAYRADCVIRRSESSGTIARAISLPDCFSPARVFLFPRSQFGSSHSFSPRVLAFIPPRSHVPGDSRASRDATGSRSRVIYVSAKLPR